MKHDLRSLGFGALVLVSVFGLGAACSNQKRDSDPGDDETTNRLPPIQSCMTSDGVTMPRNTDADSAGVASPKLGYGWNSASQQPMDVLCLNPDLQCSRQMNVQQTVTLPNSESFATSSGEFGFSVGASAGIGLFSASASADYFRKTMDQYDSANLGFTAFSTTWNDSVRPTHANPRDNLNPAVAALVWPDGGDLDVDALEEICGDKVITELKYAVGLNLNATIDFESHREKTEFETSASGSYALTSLSVDVSSMVEDYKGAVTMGFTGTQTGGTPGLITTAWTNSGGNCDIKDLEGAACKQGITNLTQYATAMSITALPDIDTFPKQIKEGIARGNGGVPHGPPVLTSFTSFMPKPVPETPVDAIVEDARIDLGERYLAALKVKRFMDFYLARVGGVLNAAESANIVGISNRANADVLALVPAQDYGAAGANRCWSDPHSCPEIQANYVNNVLQLTVADIQFTEWLEDEDVLIQQMSMLVEHDTPRLQMVESFWIPTGKDLDGPGGTERITYLLMPWAPNFPADVYHPEWAYFWFDSDGPEGGWDGDIDFSGPFAQGRLVNCQLAYYHDPETVRLIIYNDEASQNGKYPAFQIAGNFNTVPRDRYPLTIKRLCPTMTGAFRMVIKGRFDSPATGQHEVGAISRYPNVRDYYSVYPPSRYRTYPFDDGATGFACQCKKSNCSISPEQAAALAPCDQDPWAFKPGGWVQDTDLFRRRDLPVGEGAIRALPTYAMPYVYYMPELLWTTDNQWMSPGGYFKLKLIAGKR